MLAISSGEDIALITKVDFNCNIRTKDANGVEVKIGLNVCVKPQD